MKVYQDKNDNNDYDYDGGDDDDDDIDIDRSWFRDGILSDHTLTLTVTHSHISPSEDIDDIWWQWRDLMMVMTSDNNDDTSYLTYLMTMWHLMTMMTTDYCDKRFGFFLVFYSLRENWW